MTEIPPRKHTKKIVCRCTWCGHVAAIGDPCEWAPGCQHEGGTG